MRPIVPNLGGSCRSPGGAPHVRSMRGVRWHPRPTETESWWSERFNISAGVSLVSSVDGSSWD